MDDRLQSQMEELKQLRDERQRLLQLKQQLHAINKKYDDESQVHIFTYKSQAKSDADT
jgi:hypothetical protein